jgi:hypothetical protein
VINQPADLPLEIRERIPVLRRRHSILYGIEVDSGVDEGQTVAVFRPLTKRETEFLAADSEYIEDQSDVLLSLALLHPDMSKLDLWLAGSVVAIVDSIIEVSGWSNVNALVETMKVARVQAMSLEGLVITYICKAFPSITPNDVSDMSLLEQCDLLAKAEVILQAPIDFDAILNPKKKRRHNRPWVLDRLADEASKAGQIPMPGMSPRSLGRLEGQETAAASGAFRSKEELLSERQATKINFSDPIALRKAALEQRRALGEYATDA